jgi:hypothetical protein
MIAQGSDNFKLVSDCLNGDSPVNEQVFEAVAVLSERFEKVTKNNDLLAGVSFSPEFEELVSTELMSAIC